MSVKVKRGNWTEVFAEESGRNVSHVSYGARQIRLGREGMVRMAGIGGVGTDPDFRRRGLARQVLARAMEEIREDGYSCVGLYTSTRIVAHRLYRRFGLVDVVRSARAYRLLDPGRFICDALNEMLRDSSGGGSPMLVRVELRPYEAVLVRIDEGRARVLTRPPRDPQLSLALSSETFIDIWQGEITLRWAEEANLVEWRGSESSYRWLAEALARPGEPADGD